ncbi:GNAT family N-acetyltransferase [Microcoleus sp. AR_TQ3_B6]|uniref:GNAT family N-acetyltransferase n=1 Tax=Microcoleus sp. AR_TQ3_B6 TaxID=3055284 RepID=UPI002FD70EE5
MYTLNVLNDSTAVKYEKFTFPAFRYVLRSIDSQKSVIALAASYLEQPVGLALAGIREDDSFAEVLSIFVEPAQRCAGIGTALLTRLEEELSQRGCTKAKLSYITGKSTTPALERLLQKCNWTYPHPRMLICKGQVETIIEAPWMKRYSQIPSSYSIFPWLEITQEERQAIQQQQETQPWIPEDLIPFQYEKDLEPITSLGLRYQGQVVGWMINHRLSPDTIRYTCSFVRKDLQKMGRIISLYAEAAKLQLQAKISNVIWTVPVAHESMVNFVKHRWAPYLASIGETKGTFKLLK